MAPLVMGHEIGGEVVDVSNPKNKNFIGKRVAINNILVCGICYWCKSGHHAVCPSMAVAGLSADGGLQEYMTWPVTHLVPVPNNLSKVKFIISVTNTPTRVFPSLAHEVSTLINNSKNFWFDFLITRYFNRFFQFIFRIIFSKE